MARHYTADELLRLRESPLVSRPSTLPPTEQWMGPPPETNDTKNTPRNARALNRTKTEDGLATDTITNRRMPFDVRRKSTTAPEDIILGPPKTTFASASGRNPQRSTATTNDDEKTDKTRNNFRDRFSRDGQKPERDEHSRDTRTGQPHGRRFKDEVDPWSKHNKPQGIEEREQITRRKGEWEDLRERRDRGDVTRGSNHKAYGENTNHDRRNGHWRSQDGPLWAQESAGEDGGKHHSNDSRDRPSSGFNAHNRSWNRGQTLDEDPLWMEAEPAEEKKHGHTIDDFEEFRRQMKARDGKKVDNDRPVAIDPQQSDSLSPRMSSSNSKAKEKTFDFGDFNDAFLDSLSQPQKQKVAQSAIHEASKQEVAEAAAKMAKASKFSNLFSVKPETKAVIPTQVQGDASNEDRAGFQRILNLLGQQPQPQPTSNQRTPPLPTAKDVSQASPPLQSPPVRHYEDTRQAQNGPPQPRTKESEFLLNLMQQPRQANPDNQRQGMPTRPDPGNGLSGPPFSNLLGSPHSEHPPSHHHNGPPHHSFFDEPPRHEPPPSRQDRLNPSGPPLHRPAPPGISDFFAQRPGNNLPPGLERRPPGFDHLPPGYAGHAGHAGPQPQQQQRSMAPPPGFPPPQRPPTGHMPGPYGNRPNGPGAMPPPPPGFMMGGPPPPSAPPLFNGFGQDGGPAFGNAGFEYGPPGFAGPGGPRR